MNKLLTTDLWKQVRRYAKSANKKTCAISYVTDDRHIKFGKGDTLIADASNEAIAAGQTDAALLDRAFQRGADLYSMRGLHAKVFVLDSHSIVGSANLSIGSESNFEAAIQTDNPSVVSSASTYVMDLAKKADQIDRPFIDRILEIPVQKRKKFSGVKAGRLRGSNPQPRTWLVGLKPTEPKVSSGKVEQGRRVAVKRLEEESSDISTMRIKGRSKFRKEAKKGDLVITIWTPETKSQPQFVFHHSRILHRKEIDGQTVMYVEESRDADDRAITWARFKKLFRQAGVSGKPSQWSMREMSRQSSDVLHELWPSSND